MRALRTFLPTLTGRLACVAAALSVLLLISAARAADQPTAAVPTPEMTSCEPQAAGSRRADLWTVQSTLIGKCIALIPARSPDRPNIYTVAIAPLGTQTLFSREAKVALQRLAANYGGTAARGVLLSNGPADLMQVPLATQDNVAEVLGAIGQRTNAAPDDVLIVYLTSHGRPDAALASALPGNLPVLAISAESLAAALDQAHIRRRVIIISACFAGSWIPLLANDDTIVMTAARADRTSFGCDDTRPLTYFGDAFLNGPLSHGASLAESFEGARKTVTQWEQEQRLLNSEPQSYVGRNMRAFWQTPAPMAGPPAPRPAVAMRTAAAGSRAKGRPKQP